MLTWLRDLFGLGLIEKHMAWYLIHGRLSSQRALAITDYIDDRLLPRMREHALDLVDAFEFTPEHIGAPIALGGEAERQDEARAWFAERRVRRHPPPRREDGAGPEVGVDRGVRGSSSQCQDRHTGRNV